MDQAASVISLAGSALYISFFPRLSAQPIPLPGTAPKTASLASSATDASALPPRAVFVCANSLVVSDKVVHARTRYNLRVVETLVAARVLALRMNVSIGEKEKATLREVLGRVVGEDVGKMEDMDVGVLKGALERMVKEVELLKPQGRDEEGVTMDEMIEWSGMNKDLFHEVYLSWVDSMFPALLKVDLLTTCGPSRSHPLPTVQARKACLYRVTAGPPVPRRLPQIQRLHRNRILHSRRP